MPVHRQSRTGVGSLLYLLLKKGFHTVKALGVHLDSVRSDYHSLPPE